MIRKKLIEVDLPLDAINAESKREKSIRHGHPSTLHIWWARRPLAACRAVIFASMVDDPSSCPDEFPTEKVQKAERQRLHDIIREIIKWESTDESKSESRRIQNDARYEIARSIARLHGEMPLRRDDTDAVLKYLREKAPPIHDPFAGGGSIPLEAQRLGLRTIASDLNPVAVLINKALIELPPKFAGRPPVNPESVDISNGESWKGCAGLASDIRFYGQYMRDEAFRRIGHLYPEASLPDGNSAMVIAWLWARTVPCPNPACGVAMPLMTTFQLSKKHNNRHWTRPIINNNTISFIVQNHDDGVPKTGTVNRNGATCIACGTTSPLAYVREQSKAGRMGEQMVAIVAEGDRKRLFLSPTKEHIGAALSAKPDINSIPKQKIPASAYKIAGRAYGITHWHELFSQRQLMAHTILSKSLTKACNLAVEHGADPEYVDVIRTYLALAIGRNVDSSSEYAVWQNVGDKIAHVFSRQAIGMVWDYAEANLFSNSTQNWLGNVEWVAKVVERLPHDTINGEVYQANAATTCSENSPLVITDPPYYDNISYAEISDYFYVWLRPLLRDVYQELFSGILVPTGEEMIAAPRFENSKERFEGMMGSTLHIIREHSDPKFPTSIFYAYKQQENDQGDITSTGWDTILSALVAAGFQIVGTWPVRTELTTRSNALGTNSLASSIILVCRIRPADAPTVTRREFVGTLKTELSKALQQMQAGSIAPVDLAQAAIGPGMAVFTRYASVLNVSGEKVSVRDALALINHTLDETLAEQEGDFDADTRWALSWFTQFGFNEKAFGEAETLAKVKNTSVSGMVYAGILKSGAGKVRLLRPHELPDDWDPKKDKRLTVWETTHHMVRVLKQGEEAVADLMVGVDSVAEVARGLAYRLYHICDQKGRQEAQDYNALVQSWPEIARLARERQGSPSAGLRMYDDR